MQVIHSERPRARKTHLCEMCHRTIQPGEQYHRQRNTDYGDIWTWRSCEHCDAMISVLDLHGLTFGEAVGPDTMCDFEPDTIAEARIVVHYRRRWQRDDGTYYPIPEHRKAIAA